jgi:Type I phosphodiesterase / nucleotide pyrophosphatase
MVSISSKSRKVLLVEFNEITWRLVNPFMQRGALPTFSEFVREGASGSPLANEVPPDLDPWISWTSVYTGRPQSEHNVKFLEQPPETVTGPRVWEVAADSGKSLGLFGSIMSWPPRHDIKGFWIPGTFSPDTQTHPDVLEPIQDLNLTYTRAHSPTAGKVRRNPLSRLRDLARLGLKPSTLAEIGLFLMRSKLNPSRSWEKVSLQPLINADFFEALYHKHRPDLATFHTNHIAHYMHRHWRAMDPTPFKVRPSDEEIRRFGPSIEFGYKVGDRLLKRIWRLVDADTVVVLASGLGHQPYVDETFQEGRTIVRLKNIDQVVEILGLTGHCTPLSVMAPQWNLKIPDPARRAHAERVLDTAYVGSPSNSLFWRITMGDTICLNIYQKGFTTLDLSAECVFPAAQDRRIRVGDLCAVQDSTPKEGCHDRTGLLIMRGPGVRRGAQLMDCTNLDIAPTILHLLGVPIPSHMKGRVLEEAFERPKPAVVSECPTSGAGAIAV